MNIHLFDPATRTLEIDEGRVIVVPTAVVEQSPEPKLVKNVALWAHRAGLIPRGDQVGAFA